MGNACACVVFPFVLQHSFFMFITLSRPALLAHTRFVFTYIFHFIHHCPLHSIPHNPFDLVACMSIMSFRNYMWLSAKSDSP